MQTERPTINSINPHNQEIINTYTLHTKEELISKILLSKDTSNSWKKTSIEERAAILNSIAEKVLQNKQELAKICTLEMGKPLAQSLAEVEKSAFCLQFYAKNGAQWLKAQKVDFIDKEAYIELAPLGTLLAIMPWNFPYWQVFRAMAPAILAGNTMLLKHASNVTGCALQIEKIVNEAGAPAGLFQTLIVSGADTEPIIAHPNIDVIAFTGSSEVGKIIAKTAGAHLKKHVLELGGSDAYIVLEDANIDLAVEKCVKSRLNNAGQSCIAAKRWIVDEKIYSEFKNKAILELQKYTLGNPMNTENKLGPMVNIEAKKHLHDQVKKAISHGANILINNNDFDENNAYYEPTIIENIKKDNPVFKEELFGPVAQLYKFSSLDEAFQIANATPYGLGGAIFSEDRNFAYNLALKYMDTGSIAINDMVSSHPAMPFGGIKQSGYGRELSFMALFEFSNIKSIVK